MTKRERLVYSYMIALSRLYGIVEWKQFIKVFNKYNLPKITKKEINDTPIYWTKREEYCRLYTDVLMYSRVDEELIEEAYDQAKGKEYYVPTEDEILALSKPKDYMQQSAEHRALYDAIKDVLSKKFFKDKNLDETHKMICVTLGTMMSAGENQQIIFDVLGKYIFIKSDMDNAQAFLKVLMNAWNNTRMWANHGFTPNEMTAKMPSRIEQTGQLLVSSKKIKEFDTESQFAVQFYKLWYKLIYWINENYKITAPFPVPVYGQKVDEEPFIVIREKLWDNPFYIAKFLASNAADDLNEAERKTLSGWNSKFMKGKFIIHKHLADYSVFQLIEPTSAGEKLYGVRGITNSIEDVLDEKALPLIVDAVLLPFNGEIVYDTFLAPYYISFSGNMKKSFAKFYKETSHSNGIITSLDEALKKK